MIKLQPTTVAAPFLLMFILMYFECTNSQVQTSIFKRVSVSGPLRPRFMMEETISFIGCLAQCLFDSDCVSVQFNSTARLCQRLNHTSLQKTGLYDGRFTEGVYTRGNFSGILHCSNEHVLNCRLHIVLSLTFLY